MRKRFSAMSARQRAFTLVELLIVILIIGILVAVAAPSFLGQQTKAKDSVTEQQLSTAYQEGHLNYTNNGSYGTSGAGSNFAYQATVNNSSPQSDWQLADASGTTAADSAGSSPGTYAGTVTLNQPGPFSSVDSSSKAAEFTGSTSSYVKVSANSMPATTEAFTVEAWLNTTSGGGIIGTSDALPPATTSAHVPNLYVGTSGYVQGQMWWDGSHHQLSSTTTVNNGAWHFVVLSTTASGAESLYVDGSLQATRTMGANTWAPVYTLLATAAANAGGGWVGGTTGDWYPFNGYLANVAVFNSAVSAGQVLAQYQAGTSSSAASVELAAELAKTEPALTFQAGTGFTTGVVSVSVDSPTSVSYRSQAASGDQILLEYNEKTGQAFRVRSTNGQALNEAENYVDDPSFEYDGAGAPYQWTITGTNDIISTFQASTGWAASGTHSLRLTAHATSASAAWNVWAYANSSYIPVTAGTSYNASDSVNVLTLTPATDEVALCINFYSSVYAYTGQTCSYNTSTGVSHMTVSNASAPANSAYALVIPGVMNTSATGGTADMYIDDVSFTQAPVTTYVDGDQPGAMWLGTPGKSPSLSSTGTSSW
jgi:prepilin-type N-terminal cleavage/methylation domain-containing protein